MRLESDRLIIRQEESPWLGDNATWLRRGLQRLLAPLIPPENNLSYGIFLDEGPRIGRIQMMRFDNQWEIGYRIKKAYRQKGYASEAVKVFLPAFMENKQVPRVLAVSSSENLASQAILAKAGFVRIPDTMGRPILSKNIKLDQYLLTAYPKDQIVRQEAIHKGWSDDRKYKVTMEDGQTYLLRLSAGQQRERKGLEFEAIRQLSHLQWLTVRPIQLGSHEGEVCFLQEWIEGEDAGQVIPGLPENDQYSYGREAGLILKTIHRLPAPPDLPSWDQRFNDKIDRKIKSYQACPLKLKNDRRFMDYIQANRHRLTGRPQSFQHGDYHIGNMMVERGGRLRIIDFDRWDYGDPWEEFNRLAFTAELSPSMASGILDAYFEDRIPPDFWPLLAFYLSVNALSSLTWAQSYGQAEVDRMQELADRVLDWHKGMTQERPSWYQKGALPQEEKPL